MNLAENYPIEMRSLLNRMKELYNKPNAKTVRDALPDDYIGHTFVPKGAVATVSDLPATGNEVGDLYHVEEDQSEYVWLPTTDYPDGHWENVGPDSEPKKLVVTVTETGGVLSADKTFEELENAFENGKTIVAKDEYGMTYPMVAYSAVGTMDFSIVADGKAKTFSVVYDNLAQTDTWSYSETTLAGGGTEPLTVVFSAATGTATMTPAQVFSAVNNEQDVKAKFTNKYDYVGDGIVSVNKRLGDPLVSILFLRYPNATQGGEIWCIRFYGTQNATTWSVSSFKLPAT